MVFSLKSRFRQELDPGFSGKRAKQRKGSLLPHPFPYATLGKKEGGGSSAIVRGVAEKISGWEGDICVTQDTHGPDYLETREGALLPVPHCLRGTEGWRLAPEVESALAGKDRVRVFAKSAFGSRELAAALVEQSEEIEALELVGLCTDICVLSNALLLQAFLPETPITVDAACCAGVTPKSHRNALDALRGCQVQIVNGPEAGQ